MPDVIEPQETAQLMDEIQFIPGEVYLFHRSDPECPAERSLWGMFDKRIGSSIYLETCTHDHAHFSMWCCLAGDYRYCRISSRSELRDYISNQTYWEMRNSDESLNGVR